MASIVSASAATAVVPISTFNPLSTIGSLPIIVTTAVSSAASSAVAPTAVASSSASGFVAPESWTINVPSAFADEFVNVLSMLNTGLGAFVITLVLASMSYAVIFMKAWNYFQRRSDHGVMLKVTVAGMMLLSTVQLVSTIHAVYHAVVVDFSQLSQVAYDVDNEWSLLLQMILVTVLAGIAQIFFAFRLRAVNMNIWLPLTILFFTTLEIAVATYATIFICTNSYDYIILFHDSADLWSLITTYDLSAGINIVIAAVGHGWLQKPYVLTKYGKTTFMSELEYWTVKSLFGCALVSIFNAIALSIMRLNLTWLAATFVLGNLYTLSVLLTLDTQSSEGVPIAAPLPARPVSNHSAYDRASMATLTDPDATLWAETKLKKQSFYASLAIPALAKQQEHEASKLPEYTTGYYHAAARDNVV